VQAAADRDRARQYEQDRRDREQEDIREQRAYEWDKVKNAAHRNSVEGPSLLFYGDADMAAADATSGFTNEMAVHFSPAPFVSLGFAVGSGWFDGRDRALWNLSPQLGFVIPLTTGDEGLQMQLFGDGILQIDGLHQGLITDSMTPGFDVGFSLVFGNGMGMNLTYKGLWYAHGVYTHGAGVSFRFWPDNDFYEDFPVWSLWVLVNGAWSLGSAIGGT
jgi:hypothetical protein